MRSGERIVIIGCAWIPVVLGVWLVGSAIAGRLPGSMGENVLVGALFIVVPLPMIMRAWRMRISVGPEGVTVVQFFRTRRVARAECVEFYDHPREGAPHAVMLRRRHGKPIDLPSGGPAGLVNPTSWEMVAVTRPTRR